jgi:glycosyltransferase involved in cell wall biosynthesis
LNQKDLHHFPHVLGSGRVRILLDYRPALRQRTGVGEYAHGLAAALPAVLAPGDSLTLFSSSWKDRLSPGTIDGVRVSDSRIPVRVLNFAWHRLGWPPVDLLAGSTDVAHSMHPLMMPARRARVVTIHDLYFLDRPEHASAEIRRDYPRLARDHAHRADAVVVNSEYTKTQVIERLGVPEGRITVCRPGAPGWTRRSEPAAPGHILFIGTIAPRKNAPGLLGAFAQLAAAMGDTPELVLAGRITAEGLHGTGVDVASVIDRIRMPGYVDDTAKRELYERASMLVLPSFDEGFGIPALEAMAMGVPVIGADRGALPEVLGDAGLLVDPDDTSAIADAMRRVLEDSALRRRMADAGVARAAQYTWQSSAQRLYEMYRSVVARKGAA